MSRPTFLAAALTAAGSLASAHLLGALILPPPPKTITLELIAPLGGKAHRFAQVGVAARQIRPRYKN